MIISKTPYRISFFGGGSDYPEYFKQFGGQVLGTTIDKYSYITCRYLPPFHGYKTHISYSKIEHVNEHKDIEHYAINGILNWLNVEEGLSITHLGDLPARSGVASSSCFVVGLLKALLYLRGTRLTKRELLNMAIYVEQEVLKEIVGCQDSAWAAFGGFNSIVFQPNGDIDINPISMRDEFRTEFENSIFLLFTGLQRNSFEIAQKYLGLTEAKIRTYNNLKDMVYQARTALLYEDIERFGNYLHHAWLEKKSLSSCISSPQVDEIYDDVMYAGAYGGKLMGAGQSGFMVFIVPSDRREEIKEKFSKFIIVDVKFEDKGCHIYQNGDVCT